jgi:hypothetical protein
MRNTKTVISIVTLGLQLCFRERQKVLIGFNADIEEKLIDY